MEDKYINEIQVKEGSFEIEQTGYEAKFVYRPPSQEQVERAKKKCAWLFDGKKV